MFVVPANFGVVDDGVYRSALPEPKSFPFLHTLGLRSVVVVAPDGAPPQLCQWATDHGICVVHPESVRCGRGATLPEKAVTEVLSLLLDPLQRPILVTCAMGRYRTGTVIGCYRKVSRWCFSSSTEEYRRYAGGKGRVENEEFIQSYDTALLRIGN